MKTPPNIRPTPLQPSTSAARSRGRAAKGTLLAAALLASAPSAHLSILRQGRESAGSPEAGDYFGRTLCTGDFNGDGYDDLATAAPWEDVPGLTGTNHGAVIVNWGTDLGLTHVGAQTLTPYFLSESGPIFGRALASADFDSDGYDDLVVGIPFADESGVTNAGVIVIHRGGPSGLAAVPNLFHQGHFGGSIESGDAFGWALATGDINADGNPDLVIGSPGEDGSAGAVFFVYGSPSGLTTSGAAWAKQSSYGGTDGASDNFGYSVAIGQFVGVTFPGVTNRLDVAVGTPFKDDPGLFGGPNTGQVTIFQSFTNGPIPSNATTYTPISFGLTAQNGSNSNFGRSLAAGNFIPGSGYAELAIGRAGMNNSRGEVILLSGQLASLTYAATLTSSDFGIAPRDGDRFGEALAAGDWDADGNDDLGVGSPGHTPPFTTLASAGRVYLYKAAPGAVVPEDHWNQPDLGETTVSGDQLGYALAFGEFDGTGRANLAAGAPFTEGDKGQVHVIAPWRQVMGLHCRTSVALDCQDRMIFSQKPFEKVFLASTTKTMTILIAAERTMLPTNHPNYVSPNALYIVPGWVANSIGGSQFGLVAGELVTLQTLMAMTMAVSGNDCAYAVADLLTGSNAVFVNVWNVVPAFVAEMNARAAQLGMFDTTFTNPPGFSGSVPESTAYDMALLSRAAMKNPIFAGIVGTPQWSFNRFLPGGGGGFAAVPTTVNHWFVPPLKSLLPQATGIKGGGTGPAQVTGVYSARQNKYPWGTAIAGSFYTPSGDGAFLLPEGAELLELGLAHCSSGFTFLPAGPPLPLQHVNLSTILGTKKIFKLPPPSPTDKEAHVELYNQVDDGKPAEVHLDVTRETVARLPNGDPAQYVTRKVTRHGGITIVNEGMDVANLEVFTNAVGNPEYGFMLLPGEVGTIPAEMLPAGVTSFQMMITHFGGEPAELRIFETYGRDYVMNAGAGAPSMVSMDFVRDLSSDVQPMLFQVELTGQDADPGHFVGLVVRGDASFAFDPCPARTEEYGAGWNGRHGVPTLGTDAPPVVGTTMSFELGNSLLEDTSGFWAVGFQKNEAPTAFGGTLNVKPALVIPVALPKQGFSFPYAVPTDPSLCGVSFFHQLFVVDEDASDGLSFSRGLQVTIGN